MPRGGFGRRSADVAASTELGGTFVPPPSSRDEINTLLAPGNVSLLFQSGATYLLDVSSGPVNVPSGSTLAADGALPAIFTATNHPAVGQADVPTNALFQCVGTTTAGAINTTTNGDALRDAPSFAVASTAGMAADLWLSIDGVNTDDEQDIVAIGNGELIQIASVAAGRVTTKWPVEMHHSTNMPVVQALPVTDVLFDNIRLDCSGGSIANGVLLRYTHHVVFRRFEAKGFSRAAINQQDHTVDTLIEEPRCLGEVNSFLLEYNMVRTRIWGLRCRSDGLRRHANGIARMILDSRNRSTKFDIRDCEIAHAVGGCRLWGGMSGTVDIKVSDILSDDIALDPELGGAQRWGSGLDMGAAPILISETGWALKCTAYLSNCRTTLPESNATAALIHDMGGLCLDLVIDNKALGAGAVDGIVYNMGGARFADVESGVVTNLRVEGCYPHQVLLENSDVRLTFDSVYLDGNSGYDDFGTGIHVDYFGGAGHGPKFGDVEMVNCGAVPVTFGAGFTAAPDPFFEIDRLRTVGPFTHCIYANNDTGVDFAPGDVVELAGDEGGAAPVKRLVVTPGAAGGKGSYKIVACGTQNVILVSSCSPDGTSTINCRSGVVAPGDPLAAVAGSRLAAVDPTAFQPLAIALSSKGYAAGVVYAGPTTGHRDTWTATVDTTSGATTAILTFPLDLLSVYDLDVVVEGLRTGGSAAGSIGDVARRTNHVLAKHVDGVAVVSNDDQTDIYKDDAAWGAISTIAASGDDIVVSVAGLADADITWECSIRATRRQYLPASIAAIRDTTGIYDSTIATLTAGKVSTWPNQASTGAANDASQGTAGSRPSVLTVNGIQVLDADGVDDYLILPASSAFITVAAFHVFAVFSARTITTAPVANYYNLDAIVADEGGNWGLHLDTTPEVVVGNFQGAVQSQVDAIAATPTPYMVVEGRHSGGNLYLRVDEGAETGAVASGNTDSLASVVSIFKRGTFYGNVRLRYLVLVSRALLADERTFIMNELRAMRDALNA